jgi:isopropylmalate/homocitrate/citramalate synthase
LGDITVRDGFQHLEKFISTRAKIFYAEEMIFAGCRNIEVTNLGNPTSCPSSVMRRRFWLSAQRPVSQKMLPKTGHQL